MRESVRTAMKEGQQNSAFLLWLNQRKETLKSKISAHDVLRYFGTDLKSSGDHEEQICCPFHGDKTPSARIYPSIGNSPSGVYCWVCRKRWDIFGLWKEFQGDPDLKFTAVLFGLEKAFNIATPEAPDMTRGTIQTGPTEEEQEVLDKLQVCEKRLRANKAYFQLRGFLIVGHLLDNLHYQVKNKLIDIELAAKNAQLILDKIGEKARGG